MRGRRHLDPEDRVNKVRIDGFVMLFLSLPGALAGTLMLVSELAIASGAIKGTWKSYLEFTWTLAIILTFPAAFVIAYYHFRLGPSLRKEQPADLFGRLCRFVRDKVIGPCFVFYLDGFLAFTFFFVPAGILVEHAFLLGSSPVTRNPVILVVAALMPLISGLSAIRRSFWVAQVKRQIENLASSRSASAALGLVEMIGTVRPIETQPEGESAVIKLPPLYTAFYRKGVMGVMEKATAVIRTFYLEDARGKVRVDPPIERDSFAPNYFLNFDEGQAAQVLRVGDRVYILGELAIDQEESKPLLRPWETHKGSLCRNISRPFGPIARILDPFGTGHLFILSTGDEAETKQRFFLSWYRWAFFGGFLLLGGGITMAVAVAAMSGHPLIRHSMW